MGIFTHLVGGIEVRERRPRSEDEPYRHRRLEFVRPKTSTKSDDWSVIRTSYPRPQARQYGQPWEHPQWNSLSFHQQQEILARLGHHQPAPMFGQLGDNGPPPPPDHGGQYHLEQPHGRPQIEGGALPVEIVRLSPSADSDSDGDKPVEIVELRPKSKGKKGRHSSKIVHTGLSIFDSDSEDDHRGVRRRGGALSTISSSSSSRSSLSRGHGGRKGHRGW